MPSNNFNENGNQNIPKMLWNPKSKSTRMHSFMEFVNKKYQLNIETYRELWTWSTENYSEFWEEFWIFSGIISSVIYEEVVDKSKSIADIPEWFKGSRLNYAENMLRYNDDRIALIGTGEGRTTTCVTYKQLHRKVAQYAAALKNLGIETGDRVVGYLPNCIEAVEAMLAVASIGAIWSSTSPDFGVNGVLDRFHQIQPKLIFSVEAVRYNGKVHPHLTKLKEVVNGLSELKRVVVIPFVSQEDELNVSEISNGMTLSSFLMHGESAETIEFKQLPFNHPLFIMYSSGTTGPPKCMVHSAGGTLIQHMKEHMLHGNMSRDDIILYYTTTGWMMWNWLVGSLTTGATVVAYDGSPFQPVPNVIWDLVDSEGITILGTSAKCLDVMDEMGLKPCKTHDLTTLHTVLSTGSPLAPHQYDFVYGDIKENVLLGSITGGTDIISCFISQNWTVPVHRGELQSANLGIAVCSYLEHEDSSGSQIYDEPGELVCLKPFPSMPTRFWNDKDGIMYKKAYFSKFSGIWAHGDFCIENSLTNGFVMLGRSDATLNPNGVRFGTSELYAIIESQFRKEIQDSLASAQRPGRNSNNKSERVILFVKMVPGFVLDKDFEGKIRRTIRTLLSPRHVPAIILQTEDIPYTISGKKVEIAVTRILNGMPVLHKSAFRNPHSLELYESISVLDGY